MKSFLGENNELIRFILLTCGLLTLTGAVACLLLGNALFAVACCIVSAWAIGIYLDTIRMEWMKSQRSGNFKTEQHDDTSES